MEPHLKGILLAVSAVLSGSGCGIPIRMLQHSNVFTQILCRSGAMAVTLCLLALCLWRGQTFHRIRRVGWIVGGGCVFLATQDIAISAGFLMTKASNVVFIINTSPVFCAVMDRFVLKEPVVPRTLGMVCAGLCGVLVILIGDIVGDPAEEDDGGLDAGGMNNPVLGNFVVLLNPISWAFYWTTVRHAEKLRAATLTKNNKSATTEPAEQWWEEMLAIQLITTLIEAGAGTVGMLCTGWDEQWNTIRSPDDLLTYAWFGGAYIPVVILLFSLAPRYIATAEMGSIKMLETVTTPFWMYLYDKEVPSVTALVGGGLIIVAVVTWSILTLRADPQQNRRTRTDGKVPAAEGALPKIQEATPPPHRP